MIILQCAIMDIYNNALLSSAFRSPAGFLYVLCYAANLNSVMLCIPCHINALLQV